MSEAQLEALHAGLVRIAALSPKELHVLVQSLLADNEGAAQARAPLRSESRHDLIRNAPAELPHDCHVCRIPRHRCGIGLRPLLKQRAFIASRTGGHGGNARVPSRREGRAPTAAGPSLVAPLGNAGETTKGPHLHSIERPVRRVRHVWLSGPRTAPSVLRFPSEGNPVRRERELHRAALEGRPDLVITTAALRASNPRLLSRLHRNVFDRLVCDQESKLGE
jgi:hypothetical protein